jgi:hypothetical protein
MLAQIPTNTTTRIADAKHCINHPYRNNPAEICSAAQTHLPSKLSGGPQSFSSFLRSIASPVRR